MNHIISLKKQMIWLWNFLQSIIKPLHKTECGLRMRAAVLCMKSEPGFYEVFCFMKLLSA